MKINWTFWSSVCISIVLVALQVGHEGIITWVIAPTVIGLSLLVIIPHYRVTHLIKEMVVLSGTTAEKGSNKEMALRKHLHQMKKRMNEMIFAITGIANIGHESFFTLLKSVEDKSISVPLLAAHEKIIALRNQEKELNWIRQGVATLSELNHKGNTKDEYSHLVIAHVVKYLNANQGSFFLIEEKDNEACFVLSGSYAYGKKKHLEKRIALGEGMLGQVYYEKEIIYLSDVPKDHVKITSGLGEALPRSLCIVPLMSEGKIYGALEIASFSKLGKPELEYLKRIGDRVGYTLSTIESRINTEDLLSESQRMAEEVKSQEEELRQNMEELTATQETMIREQKKLETLSLVADHTKNAVVITDADGKIVFTNDGFARLTGYQFTEVAGRSPGSFLQGPLTSKETIAKLSYKIRHGEVANEEILNYRKTGEVYWISLSVNPVRDLQGIVQKYISVQTDITETKKNALDNLSKLQSISRTNAVIEFNMNGMILEANDLFYKVTGFSKGMIVGKSYQVLIPELERDKAQNTIMWENILLGQAFTGDFQYLDAKENVQWISGTYNPIFDLTGSIEKILMLGQFVTQHKEKVQELQDTIAAIKNCFPVVEINSDMTFKGANDLFLTELGVKRIELKKVSVKDILANGSYKRMEQCLMRDQDQPDTLELDILNKNGVSRRFNSSLVKINGAGLSSKKSILILRNPLS